MFDRIYKFIFYWSHKKHSPLGDTHIRAHELRKAYKRFEKDRIFIALGLYIQHVQSRDYVRCARAAILGSAISALYLRWELNVKDGSLLTIWGLHFGEINQENILLLLLALTGYYTIRLLFKVITAFSLIIRFF